MIEGFDKVLREELEALRQRIIANMERDGAVASGRTRNSLRVEVDEGGGILYGGLPTGAPFGTLETGSAPFGHARFGYPSIPLKRSFASIIYDWMQDKGIRAQPIGRQSQEAADRSLSWAIATTIRKHGTQLYRKGGRSDIYSNEIPATVDNIGRRLLDVLTIQVQSINLNIQDV